MFLYGFRNFSNVENWMERFLNSGAGKTLSLQAMGFSLSKAARNVTFVSLSPEYPWQTCRLCVTHSLSHCHQTTKKFCKFPILLSSYGHQRLPLRVQHQHFELLNFSVLLVPSAFVLTNCKSCESLCHKFCINEKP